MFIYKITNLTNAKVYIGQTINSVDKRWKEHCKVSRAKVSSIALAIQKYGKDNFTIEVVYTATSIEELNIKEQQYISEFDSMAPKGYNLTSGGLNYEVSEETRKKHSISSSGRVVTEETKRKMSEIKTGVKVSELAKYSQKLGKLLTVLYSVNGNGIRVHHKDKGYQAFISTCGVFKSKTFSFSKHGELALGLAISQRKQWEDEIISYYQIKIKEHSNG